MTDQRQAKVVDAVPGRVWRTRGWSIRVSPRSVGVCVTVLLASVAVGAVSVSVGDYPISFSEVWSTIFGSGTDESTFIVMQLRLPRALVAILTGIAFGMSGAIFQSLARNPLGSPDIIGFDSGAALGAVIVLLATGGSTREAAVGAIVGGLLTAVAVYLLAWKRGVRTYRLVLVGLGVGFVAAAAIDFMITRADIFDVQRAAVWLTGSLNARGWDHVGVVLAALVALTPVVLLLNLRLLLLELGDDVAGSLGIRVNRSKLALAVAGVLLAALAVAAVGPVAFVAFVAGPVARRLVGTPHAAVIPAAFVGGFFMLAADLAARRVLAPIELPVGVTTAMIGAPYLLYLLTRQIRTGTL